MEEGQLLGLDHQGLAVINPDPAFCCAVFAGQQVHVATRLRGVIVEVVLAWLGPPAAFGLEVEQADLALAVPEDAVDLATKGTAAIDHRQLTGDDFALVKFEVLQLVEPLGASRCLQG